MRKPMAGATASGVARTARGTYVYCAIQADPTFALPTDVAGLPGLGRPRLIAAGNGRALVVANAPRRRFGEHVIARGLRDLDWVAQCAVAHAAVVEACLGARAVVPVKLFTVFDSDERAAADLGRGRPHVDRAIRRVAGRIEWGVRIRRTGDGAAADGPVPRTGSQYLRAKRRALDAARRNATRGSAQADRVFRRLSARATAAIRQSLPAAGRGATTPLVLDAAFLVSRRGVERFAAAVRHTAAELDAKGYRVELTGPWPPYSFVEA